MKTAREVAFNVCCRSRPWRTSPLSCLRIVADACRVGNLRSFRDQDVRFRAATSDSRRAAHEAPEAPPDTRHSTRRIQRRQQGAREKGLP
jgi:hypothetical protein